MGRRGQSYDYIEVPEGVDMEQRLQTVKEQYEDETDLYDVDVFARGRLIYIAKSFKTVKGKKYCFNCREWFPKKELKPNKQKPDWKERVYVEFRCPKCDSIVEKVKVDDNIPTK